MAPPKTGRWLASRQLRVLARAFLTRFFESDITGGSNDLKTTFFWLIGFLAAPGFLIAFLMMNQWDLIARFQGVDVLRASAMSSKLLYLGFGMTGSALLAAITWNSLLLDRRDALVLGTLPVPPRTIVSAKLVALCAYLGVLALAMHGLASTSFGVVLAAGNTFSFLLRGIAAHFLAGTSASVFLFLTVTSSQGVALAAIGPRAFKRVSPTLQIWLIAGILLALAVLPSLVTSTRDTVAGTGVLDHSWMLWTPPFWFLGTYETVLGTSDPVLIALNARAMSALAIVACLTVTSYPIAYRRVAATAVDGDTTPASRRGVASLSERLAVRLSRHAVSRAAAQFFLASLSRVERLRFALAIAAGVVMGWSAPALYYWLVNVPTTHATTGVLALSLADVAFLLVGLRVAAAMPSDLPAAWIMSTVDAPRPQLRSGLWRAMFAVGVMPIVVGFTPAYAWSWGATVAFRHAVVLLAAGGLMVELLLWDFDEMPHAKAWRPEKAGLAKGWPLYLAGFLAFSLGIARIETSLADAPVMLAVFVVMLVLGTAAVRWVHQHRMVFPPDDLDVTGAPAVLGLN